MLNGKVMIFFLTVGLIKKILYKMSQYVPKPYERFGGNVKVELDLSSYAINQIWKFNRCWYT